ncbi:MAG: Purine nucleoside phosphorylase, partial [uncultured Nocardioidaceae bacterium]
DSQRPQHRPPGRDARRRRHRVRRARPSRGRRDPRGDRRGGPRPGARARVRVAAGRRRARRDDGRADALGPPRLRAAGGRRACRQAPFGARRRPGHAGLPRPHAPLRGSRRALGRARGAHRSGGRVPRDRADERLRRAAGELVPGHRGADQRPHQPDREEPDRGRELRRPDRPVLTAAARPLQGGRAVARRGGLRPVPRPALRDPRRDRHGAGDRRPPRRDVHGARGDRGPGGRSRGPRPLAGDEPGGRDQRRAAQPRRGPRGRSRRGHPDGRPPRRGRPPHL